MSIESNRLSCDDWLCLQSGAGMGKFLHSWIRAFIWSMAGGWVEIWSECAPCLGFKSGCELAPLMGAIVGNVERFVLELVDGERLGDDR